MTVAIGEADGPMQRNIAMGKPTAAAAQPRAGHAPPRFSPGSGPPWRESDLASVALLLDVDGTLLDFAPTPSSVEVSDALKASLATLLERCSGALALVSGRLVENLDGLFAPLRLPAIGGHGAQMRLAADQPVRQRSGPAIGGALRKLIAGVALDPRLVVEDKGSSLAVHYRLAPELGHELELKLRAIVESVAGPSLEILHGKLVIEIKSAGVNKGEAVRELMSRVPFAGRTPLFLGDDTTDESVFRLLPALRGFGYAVERELPNASGVFPSPRDVRAWLASLSETRNSPER